MKILHIVQFLGVGGLERVLYLLMKEQMKAGHQVEMVVYDYEQTWVESFRSAGIKVNTDYKKQEGYDFKLLTFLEKIVVPFDVVHTHDLNPSMYTTPLKLIAKLKGKSFPRLIHTTHGMDHLHVRPITKIYEKFCSSMLDGLIAVSPAISSYYKQDLLVPTEKVYHIDNGTFVPEKKSEEKAIFKKQLVEKFGIDERLKTWVAVARLVPLKNQLLLIEAAKVRKDINLLIVGPEGDKSYGKKLLENKQANVYFTGSQSNIDEILMGSDYFVSASLHEGVPISVLEAGAQSRPCLLSDIPGHLTLQEKTTDKVAAYFQSNNLESLIFQMKKMEADQGFAEQLAQNLNLCVRKNYSSEAMCKKYLKAYTGQRC